MLLPERARTRLHLTVSPGAKRSAARIEGDSVSIRVAAPAVEGKANVALITFLSYALDLPLSRIHLAKGTVVRHKVVDIEELEHAEVLQRLARNGSS